MIERIQERRKTGGLKPNQLRHAQNLSILIGFYKNKYYEGGTARTPERNAQQRQELLKGLAIRNGVLIVPNGL